MYEKSEALYLLTILECIEKIYIYVKDINSHEEFLWKNDQMNFNACNSLLIAIGEDAKKLSTNFKANFHDFNWNGITGLRNRLAHDYRGVNPELIFSIIQEFLPKLRSVILEAIEIQPLEEEQMNAILNTSYYKNVIKILRK